MIHQPMITRERIEEMIQPMRRRRMKLSIEWPQLLRPPQEAGKDWSLVLPFCETLKNAFESLCSVFHIGLRKGKEDRCYTFFNNLDEQSPDFEDINRCLQIIGTYVAIRDCLALSFAIDYDRGGGSPGAKRTRVGSLRETAKTYGNPATRLTLSSADELIQECLAALANLTCYDSATCIVAMPPSNPSKSYDLPRHLAKGISIELGKPDKSGSVRTIKARPESKSILCAEKLSAIEGTVSVDGRAFKNEIVLLIDDLYQSGVTMNYVAMLILESGAKKVFGLACEKTCSNDDNVSRR
jgi:hypothetical protein